MEPEVAGALAGAAAGTAAASLTQFILDRRTEHSHARSIARLLHRELEDMHKYIETALREQRPWQGRDFDNDTWERFGHILAGELADEELLVMSQVGHWLAAINECRRDLGKRQTFSEWSTRPSPGSRSVSEQ